MGHKKKQDKCKIFVVVRLPADVLDALKIIAREECPRTAVSFAIRKLLREGIARRVVSGAMKLPLPWERTRE